MWQIYVILGLLTVSFIFNSVRVGYTVSVEHTPAYRCFFTVLMLAILYVYYSFFSLHFNWLGYSIFSLQAFLVLALIIHAYKSKVSVSVIKWYTPLCTLASIAFYASYYLAYIK